MKKVFALISMAIVATWSVFAQDTQEAVAEAAAALSEAEDVPEPVELPKYWNTTLLTNINFGQSFLSHWAAGGYNTISLAGNVDLQTNYAKDKMIWNNRLQLDYGGMYSADKPIFQKTKDRIYLESKWGYETPIKHLSYSAFLDFKTQFGDNYDYKTPTDAQFEAHPGDEPAAWREAAKDNLKSGLFSPAYFNVGLGVLWTPAPWFSLNVAPLAGGVVIVSNPTLRNTYGMDLVKGNKYNDDKDAAVAAEDWTAFMAFRPELGAQIKADASWVINDNFSFSTQLAAFYNYLKPTVEPRITWDNKVFWKLAKFFALTLSTNLIYDPLVKLDMNNDGEANEKGVQFKEFLEFGFTYTIAHKH
ncbi:MAG: DUF3078 domain-containing protein [Bacteroidales bacterium]|nr:DUF3078 domain-containing protein [Bacteroidales bacterium]